MAMLNNQRVDDHSGMLMDNYGITTINHSQCKMTDPVIFLVNGMVTMALGLPWLTTVYQFDMAFQSYVTADIKPGNHGCIPSNGRIIS